jgi:hypothetical protein
VAYCKVAYEKGWTKGTNRCSWTFRNNISLERKANVIADLLGNQFTSREMCDGNHERRVETKIKALLASVDDTPLGKVRPFDINKLANLLKLRKTCGLT